jgi:curved DNA binding protein
MYEEQEPTDLDPRTPEVVDKYHQSAELVNRVLARLVASCVVGAKVVTLCALGDQLITEGVASKFTKVKEKGVAFPTCISVNNCVGHYSPLTGDSLVLAEGDVVKIDLGAHFDGYIAQAAHTLVCTASSQPATGRKADVICAAYFAAECALRLIRPGKTNTDVTTMIQNVASQFHCNPVEGVLSHQIRRFVIDGNNVIINKPTQDQRVEQFTFEEYDVYTVDVVMSTGEGKPKEMEARTTIYKRALDQNYNLKMKASRAFFSEINQRFPTMPFTLRALRDERTARLGLTECLKHELLEPYPVLYEKPGDLVAQFKYTVIVMPTINDKLTGHPAPFVTSQYQITDPVLTSLLATAGGRDTAASSAAKKQKKKKKRSKKKAAGGASGAGGAAAATAATATAATTTETAAATAATGAESGGDKTAGLD